MTAIVDTLVSIILFIVVLGGLVLIHELGHFITARLARVRVLEFGVGFPPKARSLGRGGVSAADTEAYVAARNEALRAARDDEAAYEAVLETPEAPRGTEYTLNWLPIGGFVKLEDENGGEGYDPRSFGRARLVTKLGILFAGVVMNLVLAFTIFTGVAWFATPHVGYMIADVQAGSPAAAAGIAAGDQILAVDGLRYDLFGDSPTADLKVRAGQAVTLLLERDGTTREVTVNLRDQQAVDGGQPALGVTMNGGDILQTYTGRPLDKAIGIGWSETFRWFGLILDGLGSLVGSIVSNPTTAPPVSGPVGIATALGDTFRGHGIVMTIYFMGVLSANLVLVNALPFPPLDGGRMLMLVLKAIPRYGRRLSIRAEQLTYAVGFMALFAFLIWITVFDVIRLGTGSPTP